MTISILLVDHDTGDSNLMSEALNSLTDKPEYTHLSCSTEVLPFLDKVPYQDLPQLIVLKQDMPKLSGIEVTKFIKQTYRYSHIPVVILSAKETEADKNKCTAAGANHIFKKPCNSHDLNTIAQTLYTLAFVQLVNSVG